MRTQTSAGLGQLGQWRDHRARNPRGGITFSHLAIYRSLVASAALLCLFRGTNMWYGYPTTQGEYSSVDPLRGQIFVYAITALVLAALCMRPTPLFYKTRRCGLLLGITFIFSIFSILFSQDIVASVRGVFAVIALSVPMLLYYFEFGSVSMRELLRRFAIATVVINILYTVAFPHYAFMTGSLAGDLRGMFGGKNLFGQYMSVLFALFLVSASAPQVPMGKRLVDACFCALSALLVIGAHSSTALAQLPCAVIVLGAVRGFHMVRERNIRQLVVFLFFIAVIWLIFVAGSVALSTYAASVGKDVTFSGRTLIWGALFPHLFDYPFTGHGFSMFRNPGYIGKFTADLSWGVASTHNSYLELALNIGLPGSLAWVAFMFSRLFVKLTDHPASTEMQTARDQEATLITVIALGATMEAGMLLAPLALWPLLAASLPLGYDAPASEANPADKNGRKTRRRFAI